MTEKKFIVVNCKRLDDQWECDANRTIEKQLYTLKEVKDLISKVVYWDALGGERYATEEDFCKAQKEYYKDGIETGDIEDYDSFEEWYNDEFACNEFMIIPAVSIEVYEIKNNRLVFRKDLSTYEN